MSGKLSLTFQFSGEGRNGQNIWLAAAAGNVGPFRAYLHMELVAKYLQRTFPFWDKNRGRDHVLWSTADRWDHTGLEGAV